MPVARARLDDQHEGKRMVVIEKSGAIHSLWGMTAGNRRIRPARSANLGCLNVGRNAYSPMR